MDRVEELEDEVTFLRRELGLNEIKAQDYQDRLEEMLDEQYEMVEKINDVIGDKYGEFEDLDSALDALLDEYSDVLEESEE